MSDTMWGLTALGGIGIVVLSNLLRARRTGDRGCLGHFFVPAEKMTGVEHVTNRAGIAVFVIGVITSLAV